LPFNRVSGSAHGFVKLRQSQAQLTGRITLSRASPIQKLTIETDITELFLDTQINAGIKHSEGFAKGMYVLPTPQPEKWVVRLATVLMLAGTIAIIYGLIELGRAIYVLLQNLP